MTTDGDAAAAGESAEPTNRGSFSIYDIYEQPPGARELRRLPSLAKQAVAVVWRADRRGLAFSLVVQLASAVTLVVQLLVAQRVLTQIIAAREAGGAIGSVVPDVVLLVLAMTFAGVASAVQVEQQQLLTEIVQRHVLDEVVSAATSVDLEAYETPAFLDQVQRARHAGQLRPTQMTFGLLGLIQGLLGVVGVAVVLGRIQPILLPFMFVAYVPLWLLTLKNSRATHDFAYQLTATDRERDYVVEMLVGPAFAKEVRLFDLAGFLRVRYDRLYEQRLRTFRALVRARLRRSLVGTAGTSLLAGGVLAMLVWLLLTGRANLASATTAAVAIQQLGGRLQAVTRGVAGLYEGGLFLEDFTSFLDYRVPVEDSDDAGARTPVRPFQRLEVDDVTFSYPGTSRAALRNISFEVASGEIVALVGENGSGKTTLAKLLCHLYTPDEGAIRWDGLDTSTVKPADLRRHIACIFQDFSQYQLSARDNIAMGSTERWDDVDAVHGAALQAGADRFLRGLPEGYDTRLGRRFLGGWELSVGQWQRVALARALFRDAPFVILDEPTAALDPRAEQDLFERLRTIAEGRTVLFISHRFSSVRNADRILVLDRGRLVEEGSHNRLVRAGGLYAELFELQAAAYRTRTRARSR